MRKFKVEIHEWYSKYEDGTDRGHLIHNTFYIEQNEGEKKTFEDVKNYIRDQCEDEFNDKFCPCFLQIYKYVRYNETKKSNTVKYCTQYNDNLKTSLDSTEFNENTPIYVFVDKARNCTCGDMKKRESIKLLCQKQKSIEKLVVPEYGFHGTLTCILFWFILLRFSCLHRLDF